MRKVRYNPPAEWMTRWVSYHLSRMEAVESASDVPLLLRFGEKSVRKTFRDVDPEHLYKYIIMQRAIRAH